MPNHFHLLLKQISDNGIPKYLSLFTNSYTRYFNTKHNRKGPLWQGPFKNVLVKDDSQKNNHFTPRGCKIWLEMILRMMHDKITKSLRFSLLDGFCAAFMVGFTRDYLVPFLLLLGGPSRHVGIMSSLPNFLVAATGDSAYFPNGIRLI